MALVTSGTNERTPAELRRGTSARASDWLDEMTADVCGARAMGILLHAIATDASPHARATASTLHQAVSDL